MRFRIVVVGLFLSLCPLAEAAENRVVADFEGATYGPGWTTTGTAFGGGPARATVDGSRQVGGEAGRGLADSGVGGDGPTGTLTSPAFAVDRDYLNMLVGGGAHPGKTCVDLIVDGAVARTVTGTDDDHLAPFTWDLRPLRGKQARLRIVDAASGTWGHIELDAVAESDTAAAPDSMTSTPLYREAYRPQFHFTPARGWMNDPNGLVYADGEYHLFFQTDPKSTDQSAMMSWGHAVSPDLVHWTQLPVALAPDEHGAIWSGSAVVDRDDTSGFGTAGRPPLVAMYTAAKDPFAQAIAYSTDRGRTWSKYAGNPVIPHLANLNRDPHLVWHGPTRRWVVVFYKDVDDTFCLFNSPDLKHWDHLQDFRVPGCAECPDFFPMPVDGNRSDVKWVFTNANGQYLVGTFDGRQFRPEQEPRTVDYGRNHYAVQTYSDVPAADGRRIQVAWMRDGRYPWMPFNQQQSFPAELTLHTTPDGPRLYRKPVRELGLLHGKEHRWTDLSLKPGDNPLAGVTGELFDVRVDLDVGNAAAVGLVVRGEPVTYSVKNQTLTALGTAPLSLVDGRLRLQLLVDRTSLETFADGGRVSLTSCFLPRSTDKGLELFAHGGTAHVRSLVVYELKSAWQ